VILQCIRFLTQHYRLHEKDRRKHQDQTVNEESEVTVGDSVHVMGDQTDQETSLTAGKDSEVKLGDVMDGQTDQETLLTAGKDSEVKLGDVMGDQKSSLIAGKVSVVTVGDVMDGQTDQETLLTAGKDSEVKISNSVQVSSAVKSSEHQTMNKHETAV